MARENVSISLPPKIRSLVDREAKRGKRSRSAVVNDALQLYFRLRRIGDEAPSAGERVAVNEGRRAHKQGEVMTLDEWRHAVELGDH